MCAPFQHEDMPTLHGPFLTTNALSGHAKVWRDLRCPELYAGLQLRRRRRQLCWLAAVLVCSCGGGGGGGSCAGLQLRRRRRQR